MAKILIGLVMIIYGIFQYSQLQNKNSWWVWTNWQSKRWRKMLGDVGYQYFAFFWSIVLVCYGAFFILDQVLNLEYITLPGAKD